jgi:hypothetical protein
MGKIIRRNGNGNGSRGLGPKVPKISPLGQRLREISDKALDSGVKTLSREQIQKLVLETRGGSLR